MAVRRTSQPYLFTVANPRLGVYAVGGDSTEELGGYRIHTFTSVVTTALVVQRAGDVEYLVVAGGGGGGQSLVNPTYAYVAGGGAGGLRTGVLSLGATSNTVTVGNGGAIRVSGSDSVFASVTSTGGGYGGSGSVSGDGPTTGANGGSGGGGANTYPWNGPATGGAGVPGQGSNGGSGYLSGSAAGNGGGGAGAVGQTTPSSNAFALGGAGLSVSISGTATTYARGGDAANNLGTGAMYDPTPTTGNGGSSLKAGSSGVIIVRYPLA